MDSLENELNQNEVSVTAQHRHNKKYIWLFEFFLLPAWPNTSIVLHACMISHSLTYIDMHQNMSISLFPTPFGHFIHFLRAHVMVFTEKPSYISDFWKLSFASLTKHNHRTTYWEWTLGQQVSRCLMIIFQVSEGFLTANSPTLPFSNKPVAQQDS